MSKKIPQSRLQNTNFHAELTTQQYAHFVEEKTSQTTTLIFLLMVEIGMEASVSKFIFDPVGIFLQPSMKGFCQQRDNKEYESFTLNF